MLHGIVWYAHLQEESPGAYSIGESSVNTPWQGFVQELSRVQSLLLRGMSSFSFYRRVTLLTLLTAELRTTNLGHIIHMSTPASVEYHQSLLIMSVFFLFAAWLLLEFVLEREHLFKFTSVFVQVFSFQYLHRTFSLIFKDIHEKMSLPTGINRRNSS